MIGKIAFVVVTVVFLALIGLLGRQLVEFTLERTASGDTLVNYWGFWLLWLGPVVIGIAAIVAGVNQWLHPIETVQKKQPPAIDSWILPR